MGYSEQDWKDLGIFKFNDFFSRPQTLKEIEVFREGLKKEGFLIQLNKEKHTFELRYKEEIIAETSTRPKAPLMNRAERRKHNKKNKGPKLRLR